MTARSFHPMLATALAAAIVAPFAAAPAALQAQTDARPAAGHAVATARAVSTPAPASVIEIVAEDYALDAPDAIPAGWTTIEFVNRGEEAHMLFIGRLPEGVTFEQYQLEAQQPFSEIWDAVQDGADFNQAMAMLGEALPAWYGGLAFVGGPGLIAPGLDSNATLLLDPGVYALECYVKAADGSIHYMEGMTRPLTVTAQRSDAERPSADIRVALSNGGMQLGGDMAPGRRVVEVHVLQNPEAGFGHSVHIARLDDDTDVADVVAWMNWFDLDGLRAPAPAEFVGGMQPMGPGDTAYFTADLEPGRYLAISEATSATLGVLMEFTVR